MEFVALPFFQNGAADALVRRAGSPDEGVRGSTIWLVRNLDRFFQSENSAPVPSQNAARDFRFRL
jgi:hypothetical protein